jgi:hypothetical protein
MDDAIQPSVTPDRGPARARSRPNSRRGRLRNAGLLASVVVAAAGAAAGVLALDRLRRPEQAPLRSSAEPTRVEKQATFLVRSTLLALQHANHTVNYGVLWHLSAPEFQRINPPERLAAIFAETRRKGLDLAIAAIAEPQWLEFAEPAPDRPWRLQGFFPTAGGRLRFDLDYLAHAGHWRVNGIAVAFVPDAVKTADAASR